MLQRTVRLGPQMPFAKMPGRVAGALERFGERLIAGVESRGAHGRAGLGGGRRAWRHRGCEFGLGQMTRRRGDADATRIQSGQNAGPRGRAERVGRISVSEEHSAPGESLDIRRLVKRGVAVERGITPSEIVGHDEHHIGFGAGRGRCRASGDSAGKQQNEGEADEGHGSSAGEETSAWKRSLHGWRKRRLTSEFRRRPAIMSRGFAPVRAKEGVASGEQFTPSILAFTDQSVHRVRRSISPTRYQAAS